VNLRVVPPNLRAFVTPTIRRLHIDSEPDPPDKEQGNETSIASTSSDISFLHAENDALRNHCVVWRKRAETQRLANLNLMKVVHTIRDQASHVARERDELQRHCSWLEHKLNDDELSRISFIKVYTILIGPYQLADTGRRHIFHYS
jgi:hypothetical protein